MMKKLPVLLAAMALSWNACAGTDVLMHVANLSPFAVEVSFPANNSDCWYDSVSDSDVSDYLGYYAGGAVPSSYQAYLSQYQAAWGLPSLSAVPMQAMDTSYTLAPAVPGSKVASVLFSGETKAALFQGCKDATSSRGFYVTLRDAAGKALSTQHYVLSDPPGSAWTLTRVQETGSAAAGQSIPLGQGGQTSVGTVLKDVVNVAGVVATVVTLGAAAAEYAAVSDAISTSLEAANASPALMTDMYNLVSPEFQAVGKRAMTWIFRSNVPFASLGADGVEGAYAATSLAWTPGARVVYSVVSDGIIGVVDAKSDATAANQPNAAAGNMASLNAASYAGTVSATADFAHPQLVAVGQSGGNASVCIYATDTLFNTECRAVGLALAVQNDGSLVFMPMPSVGSGS